MRVGDDWVELAECGLAAPAVLAPAGLDPDQWSGLALGMGLDRALMLRKRIPDIRLLPVERTMSDAQANALRDRVYAALHSGPHLEVGDCLPSTGRSRGAEDFRTGSGSSYTADTSS